MRRAVSCRRSCLPVPFRSAFGRRIFRTSKSAPSRSRPGVAVLFGNGGNIGVSYGADGTFIVDDQFAPLTGKIQAAIGGLGASPVKYLVNTHWHFSHAGGNENFGAAGALIFAQENVRTRLLAGGNCRRERLRRRRRRKRRRSSLRPQRDLPPQRRHDRCDPHRRRAHRWRQRNLLAQGQCAAHRRHDDAGGGFPFVDLSSGGNALHLIVSLDQLIAMTDNETVIIPGHGPLHAAAAI